MKLCIPYTGISHLTACQVEKGKELELKEQFDALRREHTESLQGVSRASRAPCSPLASPRCCQCPLAACGAMEMLPPALQLCGAQVGPAAPMSPGGTQLMFPLRAPESTRAGEAAAGRVPPQV